MGYDTQVTVKACGPLCFVFFFFFLYAVRGKVCHDFFLTVLIVVVPSATKKTLFQDCGDLSSSSTSDSGIVYRSSECGAMDQFCNFKLKCENERLKKDNKKLLNKLSQLQTEAQRGKENTVQKR
jgi:hypothetical protein